MSLSETISGGQHAYFDSAATLLFFLLIGRVLDHRARGQARATADQLLALRAADVAVLDRTAARSAGGRSRSRAGDLVLVGRASASASTASWSAATRLDASLVTGESLPVQVGAGAKVFAGTLNLGAPVTVRATRGRRGTLLAECVRLIEAAEARRGRFVVLADRVARRYAPTVHVCSAATFLWWCLGVGAPVGQALLTACAVLIITCPCALALAVPAVQVIAAGICSATAYC